MNKALTVSLAIATLAFAGSPASAQMTEEAARASLAPFYKALNAVNAKDAPELIGQSTTPGWVTCRDSRGRCGPGSVAWRKSWAERPAAWDTAWSAAGGVVVRYGPRTRARTAGRE